MNFNPQNSNLAKLELEKTWKTHITRGKTQNTLPEVELDTCLYSPFWNLMKLELDKKWAQSGTTIYAIGNNASINIFFDVF